MDISICSSTMLVSQGICIRIPYLRRYKRHLLTALLPLLHRLLQVPLSPPSKHSKAPYGIRGRRRTLRRHSPPTSPPCTTPQWRFLISCIKATCDSSVMSFHLAQVFHDPPTIHPRFFRCRHQAPFDWILKFFLCLTRSLKMHAHTSGNFWQTFSDRGVFGATFWLLGFGRVVGDELFLLSGNGTESLCQK